MQKGAIFGGFILGVLFRSFFDFGVNFSFLILLLGVTVGIIWFVRRHSIFLLTSFFLLTFALGALRYDLADYRAPKGLDPYIGQSAEVIGILRREPAQKGEKVRMIVDVDGVETKSGLVPTRARVLANVPPYPSYRYGDRLKLSGKIVEPENFSPDFDWVDYLKKDDIYYEIKEAKISLLARGQGNVIQEFALRVRHSFLDSLRNSIPEPESALGAGITVGEDGNAIADLQDVFRVVGLSHVVVVSGYNLTIVSDNVAKILWFLPRTIAFGTGAIALIFFVLLCGGGASVLRAAAMALIAIFVRSTGRLYEALWALLLAGTVMLLWNPRLLVFDMSFQLSFLATLGLIFLSPITERWPIIRSLPSYKYAPLKEHATATCAALLAVTPLILVKMGNFSLVAIPANLLVLSFIPYSMFFVAATGALGIFSQILAFPFATIAYILLSIVIGIARIFASLPFASIENLHFPAFLALLCYVGLVVVVYRDRHKKERENIPDPDTSFSLGDDFTIEEVKD